MMILGGTAEARALAEQLAAIGAKVATSLAGATRQPASLPGEVRIGGFGGVEGMVRELTERGIEAVVDATHPFASTITANAVEAAMRASCPLLILRRPPWSPSEGADWQHFPDIGSAVDALPAGARPLLATGSGTAPILSSRTDLHVFLRSIEPVADLSDTVTRIVSRPPFSVESETDLLRRHGITHLVTKNSGGPATRAKLDAATNLGLPVLMIDRPGVPGGVPLVETVAEAVGWLLQAGVLDTRSDPAP